MSDRTPDSQSEQSIEWAADNGLKIALIGRTILLAPVTVFVAAVGVFPSNVIWPSIIAAFTLAGLLLYRAVGTRFARGWYKYLLFVIDVFAIAAAFYVAPLTEGGDPPRILMFRSYGPDIFYILVGAAALTLSPGLVLAVGAAGASAWLTLFYKVIAGMETTLSWSDLPPASDAATYMAVTLSPNFIAETTRWLEASGIMFTALLLAFAVYRARTVVIERARLQSERQQIEGLFGRYVPKEVVANLVAADGAVRPERRVASLLYLDVEGFTSLTERRSPEDVMAILSAFFDAIGQILARRGGTVTNLQGDALVGCFNAPVDVPDHAEAAVQSAREILRMLSERRFLGEELSVRIGINTGEVAAGTVGGTGRQTYTVHGDAINIAARLEALNKETRTRILITAETAAGLADRSGLRAMGELPIRGKSGMVEIFSPVR